MRTDGAEVADHAAVTAALRQITVPITFLRAERGLLDGAPFYPDEAIARWSDGRPVVRARTVADTNHYSLVLGDSGAAEVADAVTEALRAAAAAGGAGTGH
jgi:hypothetical protein